MDDYVPIFNEEETEDPADRGVLGYVMLDNVTKQPALPEASTNDDMTLDVTLNVGAKPKILAANEE